ncbi:MAG: hypothetical protein E6G92_12590 [Alphaproteobacteria bacterium]|nr:MAG: hypothetical protein E6G92_12590 [Alphaproteobacteria bacterium]
MARATGYFQIIPRGRRAMPILRTIRRSSSRFKAAVAARDTVRMESTSARAWTALASLFEILRNAQDEGILDAAYMNVPSGFMVDRVGEQEQAEMVAAARIVRSHANYRSISLREALNKIAHFQNAASTYRIDGRRAHYLILGGTHGSRRWIAEILLSKLCQESSRAARSITRP